MTPLLSIFVLVRFPPVLLLLLLFSILSSAVLLLQAVLFPRDAAAVILFHLFCFLCFFVSDAPWNTDNKSESLSAPAFAVVWSLVFPSTYLLGHSI